MGRMPNQKGKRTWVSKRLIKEVGFKEGVNWRKGVSESPDSRDAFASFSYTADCLTVNNEAEIGVAVGGIWKNVCGMEM